MLDMLRAGLYGTGGVSELGLRHDGWSEVVEGLGSQAGELDGAVRAILEQREIPLVQPEWRVMDNGNPFLKFLAATVSAITQPLFGKKFQPAPGDQRRTYFLLRSAAGPTAAVSVGQFGQDLFMSWSLHMPVRWNISFIKTFLKILAIIAILVGLLPSLLIIKYSFGGFLAAFSAASLLVFVKSVGWVGGIFVTIGTFLMGNPLYFFIRELTPFELDDMGALATVCHRSMLQAADAVGIDSRILRVKQQYGDSPTNRVI